MFAALAYLSYTVYFSTGPDCSTCSDNYFGSPSEVNGTCETCDCNNNIDLDAPGNCDTDSGECLQCIYNTEGFNCEKCKAGFYGDALTQSCIGKNFHFYFSEP